MRTLPLNLLHRDSARDVALMLVSSRLLLTLDLERLLAHAPEQPLSDVLLRHPSQRAVKSLFQHLIQVRLRVPYLLPLIRITPRIHLSTL